MSPRSPETAPLSEVAVTQTADTIVTMPPCNIISKCRHPNISGYKKANLVRQRVLMFFISIACSFITTFEVNSMELRDAMLSISRGPETDSLPRYLLP
jgi:hypothetical protein